MCCDMMHEQVAVVAEKLPERTDELGFLGGRAVTWEVSLYQCAASTSFQHRCRWLCSPHVAELFSANAGETEFDPAPQTELRAARARDGGTAVDL